MIAAGARTAHHQHATRNLFGGDFDHRLAFHDHAQHFTAFYSTAHIAHTWACNDGKLKRCVYAMYDVVSVKRSPPHTVCSTQAVAAPVAIV